MTVLTTKKRKSLPKTAFALPAQKAYPIMDKAHAINAKARATQMEAKGKLSHSATMKVMAAANKVIKGTGRGR